MFGAHNGDDAGDDDADVDDDGELIKQSGWQKYRSKIFPK